MSRLSHVRTGSSGDGNGQPLLLSLEIRERVVLDYLQPIAEAERPAKALEALKVGVIAIQSASPTLDTQVVQKKFAEVEASVRDQLAEFKRDIAKGLADCFEDGKGRLPRSLAEVFGEKGSLGRTFDAYFNPHQGRLASLIDNQVGPSSRFGKLLDPKNRDGLLCHIEHIVKGLVDGYMKDLLAEFDLNEEDSAISRLKGMFVACLAELKRAQGVKDGRQQEAERGHVKGFVFQDAVYERLAGWGRELEDLTDSVGGIKGQNGKDGDHLITLGETSGAPGLKIVVETKDQSKRLRDAREELQRAKKNRGAVSGIYAFSKGCEPPEVGDFLRVGDDFFCTVDKEALAAGAPLLFVEAAYRIARVLAVAAARKEGADKLDVEAIEQHIDALTEWVKRMGEVATKASTIKKNGEFIETTVKDMQADMQVRLKAILGLIRHD